MLFCTSFCFACLQIQGTTRCWEWICWDKSKIAASYGVCVCGTGADERNVCGATTLKNVGKNRPLRITDTQTIKTNESSSGAIVVCCRCIYRIIKSLFAERILSTFHMNMCAQRSVLTARARTPQSTKLSRNRNSLILSYLRHFF